MEFRRIGNSGLRVSVVGLGGNNFGGRADATASVNIISQALDMGITFIDTAESYNDGRSEELVGKAVKGKRNNVVIATKFGASRAVGPDNQPASRRYVMGAIDASLKRLGTDYIDLYYLHYNDVNTPIEETLRALNDIVRAGKARYIACSNFAGWQLADAAWTAKQDNLMPFIAVQMKYNMLERSVEKEIVPCCVEHDVSVIPWGPLASGFLTGKYQRGKTAPAGTRFAGAPMAIYSDVMTEGNFDKLEKIQAFAKERGHTVGELAIAWLLAHPWLGSVIAGAMNAAELKDNINAANWKLTVDDVAIVNKMI